MLALGKHYSNSSSVSTLHGYDSSVPHTMTDSTQTPSTIHIQVEVYGTRFTRCDV